MGLPGFYLARNQMGLPGFAPGSRSFSEISSEPRILTKLDYNPKMHRRGIEPRSKAWEAFILTVILAVLDYRR